MSNTMQLRYTSIKDLMVKCHIDYKGKKPLDVYTRLPDMRKQAEKFKMQGDEEAQYIMLKRWVNSVEWLKKTPEYRSNVLTNISINQINEVKNMLADLDRRLTARYQQYAREKMMEKAGTVDDMDLDIDTSMTIDSFMPPIDCPIGLPETPTKDPMCDDNEEFITCDHLYQLIFKSDNRYLIIDIRPKDAYDSSRISSNRCINIPESEIRRGVLPSHLEKYIHKDKTALDLFKRRGAQYTDVLVLMDHNTTTKPLPTSNHLYILKQILEEWDPGIRYNRITILDGGYLEWLNCYPAFTSNPNISELNSNNTSTDILEISKEIVYPEWMHSDDEDIIMKPREKSKNRVWTRSDEEDNVKNHEKKLANYESVPKYDGIKKTHTSSDKARLRHELDSGNGILPDLTVSQEADQISRQKGTIPRQYEHDSFKHQYKNPSKQTEIAAKPVIDRSSKPTIIKASSEAGIILKLMRELNDITKNKEKLEIDILEQEKSLYMFGDKYKGTNEEENIHRNLKALYIRLEETQRFHEKIEEELAKYSKDMNLVAFTNMEKNEKDNLELNLFQTKWRIKSTSTEREKLRLQSTEEEFKEMSKKESGGPIHKEPLKTDTSSMTGALERSYSSPNLLQLIDRKAPRVDRSSKPQIPTNKRNGSINNENVKLPHIAWANREERMTPVHGSVHPGITGLKNLGNSCYMNSIIQCLSNTTHLAKYFTDNLYVDDLNTIDSATQGQVVEEVAQVIKALWRGQYKSISPHDLKIAVGQYKLQFESYEQQDSHEFLTFLLDWMHNDLKKKSKTQIKMTVADKAWDKAMGSQKSIISDLFFGQLRSTITCSFCKQGSTTYETFNSLTTSLPHSNRCTLNDCIQRFVTGQKVVGWKCPKCQMAREATKKFDFVKLPPIIVIHLNRFAESGGWLEKRNTAVDFPLTGLNLKRFLVTDNIDPISDIRNYNYNLYAMSNHYGTMDGGHYTAFCKNAAQNKWYKYDDQTVTEVTSSQVKSQNTSAYLLFYTSFSSNIM